MDELIKDLQKLVDEHEKQANEIRLRIRMIEYGAKAKALVGKCFKYNSGYGFGFNVNANTYKRVVGYNQDQVIVDSFQLDTRYDKIEVNFHTSEFAGNLINHSSIKEISEKKYFSAYNKIIKIMKKHGKKEK